MRAKKPHIIVLGNEKGGTGKSTVAMHLIVGLLDLGFKVASIDVDARQGTLTRYVENRKKFCETREADGQTVVPQSQHVALYRSEEKNLDLAQKQDEESFSNTLESFSDNDFIVVDTPGSDTYLSRFVHSHADTLITPLNDSFIDLDLLVRLKEISMDILRPSTYAEMVWEQKKQRAIRDGGQTDWIVLRNRLSMLNAKNKEEMERILALLSKRIGYRLAAGFSERVIFRELFHLGLTVLDLQRIGSPMTLSHIAAKQELKALIQAIKIPQVDEKMAAA